MKRKSLIILLIIFWFILLSQTKYEWYEGSQNTYMGLGDNNDAHGQSFTVGTVGDNVTFKLDSIGIYCSSWGSPNTITMYVKGVDGSGYPSGDVLASGTLNGNVGDWVWKFFDLRGSDFSLTQLTKYAFYCRALSWSSGEFMIGANSGNNYAGGNNLISWNGVNWGTDNYDALFQVWGHIEEISDTKIDGKYRTKKLDGKVIWFNKPSGGESPPAPPGDDTIGVDIYYVQDFETSTVGDYDYFEMSEDDFPGVTWADPRYFYNDHYYWNDYNGIKIVQDGDNRLLRHWTLEGERSTSYDSGMQWEYELPDEYYEVYFSYKMRLPTDWDHAISGKFFGTIASPFSDPEPPDEDEGVMDLISWTSWNGPPPDSAIIMYYYHQDQVGETGDVAGFRLNGGAGDIYLWDQDNQWHNYTMRVVMNTVNGEGNDDGIIEAWIDGVLLIQVTNVHHRNYESINTDMLVIANFYGGDDTYEYAPDHDTYVEFDDLIVWEYHDTVSDVPHGNNPSEVSHILRIPQLNWAP